MEQVGRYGFAAVGLLSAALIIACGGSVEAGRCEANKGGNQQTLQLLNALLAKDRDNTAAYVSRARCHYFVGMYMQAFQDASEALRRDRNHAEAYLIRAKAGKMLGAIPQAVNDYTASIRLHPTADAYYGRALTYVREFRENDRQALDDFTAAIRLDPKHMGAYKFRAEIYSRNDQFEQALQDSEMVLKLDPDTPNAYCNVGFAHYALGHDAEGRRYLDTCYQKDPDPQTRGYYEAEVSKVLFARQASTGGGGGGYSSDQREKTPLDLERERQQNVYESLRNSGFEARAEACRNDSSKC